MSEEGSSNDDGSERPPAGGVDGEDDAALKLEPHPGGRPTLYQPEFCQQVADWCAGGATDMEIAEFLDISVSTYYRWRAQHPEFREAAKLGKEVADDRIEATMYRRAAGYYRRAVKIMQDKGCPVIVPYVEYEPPDTGAMMNWLTNRRGDKWRAKQSLEHSGPGGGPIESSVVHITPEQAVQDYLSLIKGQ